MTMRVLVLVGLLMTNAAAADEQISGIVGAGSSSCGQFLQHTENYPDLKSSYLQWAQGFLSGVNLGGKGIDVDLSDYAGQHKWLENYCQENPLKLYVIAVTSLWYELREQQGLEPKH